MARSSSAAETAPSRHDPHTAGVADDALFARLRARAEHGLAPIELVAHRLLDRKPIDPELNDAVASCGALARGFGGLQLDSLARLARQCEAIITGDALDPAAGVELAGVVDDIRATLGSAIAQVRSSPPVAGTVVALGEPNRSFDAALWVLAGRGHDIVHDASDLPKLAAAPDAVLVTVGDRLLPALRTTLRAVGETWAAPVILLHADMTVEERSELAPLCTTLLPSSTPAAAVSEEILRVRAARTANLKATVIGVPDVARLLEDHGFTVRWRPTDDPRLPDEDLLDGGAVILGPDLGDRRRADLTRLIRATTGARHAPIVWPGPVERAPALLGAHLGVMVTDEIDDDVAARVATEIRRTAAAADPATNRGDTILHWHAAHPLIDRSLVAAQRTNTLTAVASIEIGQHATTEQLERARELLTVEFRRGDVVAERDTHHFVVALQGIGRRVAVERLGGLAPRLGGEGTEVRIGVAEFPSDGRSAGELVAGARQATLRSLEDDGPSVVSTTWRPTDQRAVEVLIVDADMVLGEMIGASLDERGHRCEVLTDGHEALQRLTAAAVDELPRILIVDLDVGGVDGRALLRSLRPTGLLAQIEVLALSSRTAENDIRLALDLGAADIVRKPFPTTLLLHRVGRLIAG